MFLILHFLYLIPYFIIFGFVLLYNGIIKKNDYIALRILIIFLSIPQYVIGYVLGRFISTEILNLNVALANFFIFVIILTHMYISYKLIDILFYIKQKLLKLLRFR